MALLIVLTMSHPHVGFYSKINICFYAKFYGQSFVNFYFYELVQYTRSEISLLYDLGVLYTVQLYTVLDQATV